MRTFHIGGTATKVIEQAILEAKTIVWNGPQGVFEMKPFVEGTRQAMVDVVKATEQGATTIIGGGDTATAAKQS